jgi:hypothetical protein
MVSSAIPNICHTLITDKFGKMMRENVTLGTVPFRKAYQQSVIDRIEVDDRAIRIIARRKIHAGASHCRPLDLRRRCSQFCTKVAHPTRFERVASPSEGNGPSRRFASLLSRSTMFVRPRRDASLGLAQSEKILLPPLMSGSLRTAAAGRDCTRGPSGVRIDADRRTANSRPSSFARVGGGLEIQSTRGKRKRAVTSYFIHSEI